MCNLRFALKVSKPIVEEFRWKQRPLQARQSSLRVYLMPKQLIAGLMGRYRGEVVSKGP